MSRPSKLTPSVQSAIVGAVRDGSHPVSAARSVGVPESTFRGWLNDPRERFQRFRDEIDQAEARAEIEAVGEVRKVDRRWWLERRHRDRWGRPAEVVPQAAVVSVPRDAPLDQQKIFLTREDIKAVSMLWLEKQRRDRGLPPVDDTRLDGLGGQ